MTRMRITLQRERVTKVLTFRRLNPLETIRRIMRARTSVEAAPHYEDFGARLGGFHPGDDLDEGRFPGDVLLAYAAKLEHLFAHGMKQITRNLAKAKE
jgi:hypothetical protein